MFRKPKKTAIAKVGLRRKRSDEEEGVDNTEVEVGEPDATELVTEARRQVLQNESNKRGKKATITNNTTTTTKASTTIMHHFEASSAAPSQKDLATSTNEHHPTKVVDRGNKLLAGPIRAPTNIRTTCRFDYQPDICKDYKDTGFCGFGDTCIYLHDRGDTQSGWQLEQQWQEEQELKKKKQQEEMEAFMSGGKKVNNNESNINDDDGLPFACYLCRNHFTDPVVTNCGHYFCQPCLLKHVQEQSTLCPVCNKDTHGVFHEPSKLLSKKRKVSGRESTWKEFHEACTTRGAKNALENDD